MQNTQNDALKFAIKLISLRRRSVLEITKRLEEKEYNQKTIEYVLKELNKYKYLDDEQFAESYINDRINFRPCGKFLIKKELAEKGISEKIIDQKIEEILNEEKEIELAKKTVDKKLRTINKDIDKQKLYNKISSYLQSKGYTFFIINRAIEDRMK